ncbi:hypothetical protein Glove_522g21 [Diversispora epigaea]|uniref:Methyltransferase domain-containing protein n=1 Tax=Diversispora epigaea TaxID=1348612 RepID=A0A397GHT0_9GLOM|nr:hypothetical protein Glove_522g21 [Diversispora epigaea]
MGAHNSKSPGTINEKKKTKNKSNDPMYCNEEFDNASFHHFLFKNVWGKSYSAPIDEMLKAGGRVLDVGCSTGSFLLDCAVEFPKSEFVGIDISPIFPTQIKPTNVTFQIHDIRKPFPFEDESFDFIHLGFIRNYISIESWKLVTIPEILRILKPGGWVEFMESNNQLINSGEETTKFFIKFYSYLPNFIIIPFECYQETINSFNETLENITTKEITIGWNMFGYETPIDLAYEIISNLFSTLNRLSENNSKTQKDLEIISKKIKEECIKNKTESKIFRIYAQKKKIINTN